MIRINLLPVRVSKKKAAGKQQLVLFALVIVAGYVGNFVWAHSRGAELQAREAKLAKTKAEITQLDRIIGEVKNIKEQQAQLREKLDTLGQLKAGRTGPVRVMDALATLTPKRLWLTRFEDKGGSATIVGQAATIEDVSAFMSALKGNPHFGPIELTKTAANTGGKMEVVDFTLTTTINYAPKPVVAAATAPAAAPGAAPGAAR